MDPLEKAIRRHLADFLAGSLSLNGLQDWLVTATRNMEATASPNAVHLAYSIDLVLAEFSSGYLTSDQLRADLLEIAARANTTAEAAIGA